MKKPSVPPPTCGWLLAVMLLLPIAAQAQYFFPLPLTINDPIAQEEASFGKAMAGVGDVNGDGSPDILIGAPLELDVKGRRDPGQAYVFSGRDGTLLHTLKHPEPKAFALFGLAVGGIRDVNGDAIPDLLVSAPGQMVGLCVGMELSGCNVGRVFIFSGKDGKLFLTVDHPNPQGNAYFGRWVADAGDVNGDAIPDLLVSAAAQTVEGRTNQGEVYVLSGKDGSLLLTLHHPNPQAGAFFGRMVATVGDVNGDGRSDFLIGAAHQQVDRNTWQGQAYVFSGKDGGLLFTLDNPIPQPNARFGWSVAGVGDVNGDGIPDLLVGAPFQREWGGANEGKAYVFSGKNGSLLFTISHPTPQPDSRFGWSVAGVGDVNGDGIPDLLVGAPSQKVLDYPEQGQAYVFSGKDGSLLAALKAPEPQSRAEFSLAVAAVGDTNRDGLPELLIGAPFQDVKYQTRQGQAYLFWSNDTKPPTVKILAPNGGETLVGGSATTIRWDASDNGIIVSHEIRASLDGGETFPIVLAENLPGEAREFKAEMPKVQQPVAKARIQVVALDAAGNKGIGTSDANLHLIPAP